MNRWIMGALALAGWITTGMAQAQELIVEKKVFELPSFTTQSGRTLKQVRVGWESYGTLNADKSNAVLICHFFSGNSHAAGKYAATDPQAGYWDAIIGPGKAIDTDKYFVIASDTLVNLNTGDPKTTTTGPASIDPDTGKPYGLDFPVVTVRDFVEVQKALVESLGIKRLALVAGPSMGSLQTFEWAASHPEMVAKAMPVIGAAEADAMLIGWLDVWAAPILVDPNWNGGDYYGKAPPLAGLAKALTAVTLHANHQDWANATFGRRPAKEGKIRAGRSPPGSRCRACSTTPAWPAPSSPTPTTSSISSRPTSSLPPAALRLREAWRRSGRRFSTSPSPRTSSSPRTWSHAR